jgi:uncharacterized membrane protein
VLTLGAVIWVAALVGAAASRETSVVSAGIYHLASTVCHQRPERSFTFHGHPLPVCARCFGLYVSGALGAVIGWAGLRRAPRRSRELILLAALPTAATVAIEWLGFSPLSNVIRASAALPFGAVAGWTFVRALRSER